MALSNGKAFSGGPLIFLSPRSQKTIDGKKTKVDPHFEISRVGADGKIAPSTETCTEVSGKLIKIDFKDREFNNAIAKHAILYIKDGNDTYHLDLTYRISSRSLFNALLSLKSADNLSIGIYESKKGYETFSLRQDDVIIKWKHEIKDLPLSVEIKDTKGNLVKTDYCDVDQFFEDELRALSLALFGAPRGEAASAPAAATKGPAVAAKAAPAVTATPAAAVDDSSVPF